MELARLVGIAVGVTHDAVVTGGQSSPAGRGTRVREHRVSFPDELWFRPGHWASLPRIVHLYLDVLGTSSQLNVLGCAKTE